MLNWSKRNISSNNVAEIASGLPISCICLHLPEQNCTSVPLQLLHSGCVFVVSAVLRQHRCTVTGVYMCVYIYNVNVTSRHTVTGVTALLRRYATNYQSWAPSKFFRKWPNFRESAHVFNGSAPARPGLLRQPPAVRRIFVRRLMLGPKAAQAWLPMVCRWLTAYMPTVPMVSRS